MEMIYIIRFFLVLMLLNQFNYVKSYRKLIFVYEHVRHGARGPSASYDSIFNNGVDEYNVRWDTDGELSPVGKRQHYLLGIRNRLKYKDFLNLKKYNPMEILIHATDYNRTHQSINSELMAMYEECEEPELNDGEMEYQQVNFKYFDPSFKRSMNDELEKLGKRVNSKSVPVFNIRKFPDKRIFLVDNCIKLNQYRDEKVGKKVKEFYAEFDRKYADAFKTFINPSYFHDYNKMKSITDHFICDYDNHKDLSIVTDLGIDLEQFYNYSRRFYGSFIFDWFVDEYTSGFEETHLMQDLLGYMDRRIKHYPNITYHAPKMVMDCGHDTTVGPIARFMSTAFNIKYHEFCEFACNVYFELYKDSILEDKYYVDYYLDEERLIYNMDYNEFKEKMQNNFWNDTYADQFCGKEDDTVLKKKKGIEEYGVLLLGATIISTSLFLIFVTSTVVFFRRLKKLQKKLDQNPLLDKDMEGTELGLELN